MTPAQVLQDLDAMFFRQVNVQDHQARAGSRIVAVRSIEETRCLFTIFDDMEGDLNATSLDRFPNEENIGGVVFNHQNRRLRITRRYLLIEGW